MKHPHPWTTPTLAPAARLSKTHTLPKPARPCGTTGPLGGWRFLLSLSLALILLSGCASSPKEVETAPFVVHAEEQRPDSATQAHPQDMDLQDLGKMSPAPVADMGTAQGGATMDFMACVQSAVKQSPYLRGPMLKIQVQELDEKDAFYHLFPSIYFTLVSDSKLGGGDSGDSDGAVTLGLTTGGYKPIGAWFEYEAQKEVTLLTKLTGVAAFQRLLQQVAQAFITLDYLDRQMAVREQMVALSERAVDYAVNLKGVKTSAMDVKVAQQQAKVAQASCDTLANMRTMTLLGLKDLLGLDPYARISPDAAAFLDKIQEDYAPKNYTYEYAEANNIQMQMQKVKIALAEKNITAQWANILPTFNFSVRQPDKITNSENDDPYYLTASLQFPIWRWGQNVRAFDRAELLAEETRQDSELERLKFRSAWMTRKMRLRQLLSQVELAEGEAELAQLLVEKKELEYNAGQITYQHVLDAKRRALEDQLRTNELRQQYFSELLTMLSDTGDLMRRYVSIEDELDVQ